MSNLFEQTSSNARSKFKPLLGAWAEVLPINTLFRLETTLKFVKDDAIHNTIYPAYDDVFKIYRNCSFEKTRVVILGQDPYFNGNANGYAFGCKIKVSPSLKSIIKSIEKTCENTDIEKNISLDYLVEQGVFLLNTILTVRAGVPLSHANIGWQSFTTDTITLLNKEKKNLVFMLWGNKAKKYKNLITNPSHLVLEDTHPASATYDDTNWISFNFMSCNEFFKRKKQETIRWK